MISSTVLLPFLIIQFSVAFSPGLIIALVVNQSVQNSRRKGIEVGVGAAVGAIGITLVSAIVVSLLVNTVPVMINIIYFIGSIYIIFKGYQTITSDTDTQNELANNSAFLSGFQVNLLNPKMWVFYLTVLPIYMSDETSYFMSLIYLGLITLAINFIADITYAFTSDYFFRNSSDKTKNLINKVSGISLLLIGIYLFVSKFI
ncbi:LysE family translocator [Acidimicrobiia bacterium]|nr:LysE family translocator [Acidimicrobiia bacterium]MDA7572358.1 LysE family translocator [bacterium]MDA8652869.1 LysE family translocator [Candidatus Actinomarina sp.]MDA7547890.1 LysE family translocator [Acidimicrobiia bacterium]MDA7595023.1 LysE family translocator [Acidimicrobiia bacterium]